MSSKTKSYNRRKFLKVSTAAGGGLCIGFSFLSSCSSDSHFKEIVRLEKPEIWSELNGFIQIGENGITTIMSPNPEIGQNIKTAMPMIITEELDVDWDKVIVQQAPLNTAIYKRQLAGGSQSIRQGWNDLRQAGASARKMILDAASIEWGVPFEELRTEKGIVYHEKSERSEHYGKFADMAGQLEIPDNVNLKDPKDFSIIGKGKANVDGIAIVTGEPIFGMDYMEEGAKIAMIEHAPGFGQTLTSFNKDEIKSMPGIIDVFELNTDFYPKDSWIANPFKLNSLIAIVGESTWQVMQAKKAIKAEWSYQTEGENTEEHWLALDNLLQNESNVQRKDGDPVTAFKEAAQVIAREYTAPFLPHNTMAPMNFFADVNQERARLMGPIQTPEITANLLADILELPKEKVEVGMTRMGGGFGRRLYGNWVFESAMISKKINSPIKLIYTREDDMTGGVYRPAYKVRYRAALNELNELVGFEVKGAGIHGGPVFSNRFPAGTVDNYQAENLTLESTIATGAWRAPRSNFIAGAEQSFLDELAEIMGKDPIEFRLELFERAIDRPIGESNDYDPKRYAGVLKLVKEKSGWGEKMDGIFRGVSAYYCHNSYVAQVLDIIMDDGNPRIKKVWCAVDCGIVINPLGAKNQIEGGIVDGIGHAMFGKINFTNGKPDSKNFNSYQMIRSTDAPLEIETFFVENGENPTGLGEPTLPPIMGALANALYKATGKRIYDQPFSENIQELG